MPNRFCNCAVCLALAGVISVHANHEPPGHYFPHHEHTPEREPMRGTDLGLTQTLTAATTSGATTGMFG